MLILICRIIVDPVFFIGDSIGGLSYEILLIEFIYVLGVSVKLFFCEVVSCMLLSEGIIGKIWKVHLITDVFLFRKCVNKVL